MTPDQQTIVDAMLEAGLDAEEFGNVAHHVKAATPLCSGGDAAFYWSAGAG